MKTLLFISSEEESGVSEYAEEEESDGSDEDGDSGESEGGQSPVRKRTRGGTPGFSGRGRARRSRGRGQGGRARGSSGRGRSGAASGTSEKEKPNIGFEVPDVVNELPPFTPHRPSGIHFEGPTLRGTMTTELEFFNLFLNPQMISAIVAHTNTYAQLKVGNRGYHRGYVTREGEWIATSDEEVNRFVVLLIYFGLVKVSGDVAKYWSTKTIYHGLWARKILPRHRYQALAAFLHVVDPTNETPGHKLHKVDAFVATFKERCKLLYQPTQKLAVDERMVKSKHRSGIRQYMKDKPTKWGLKLWVLADSNNAYTVDFNIYIGKDAAEETSEHGLGYDVVMKLMEPYLGQGYHLYLDNFYTSPDLVKDLFLHGTPSTGTVKPSRKGFPDCLKDTKVWTRKRKQGDVCWIRHSPVLALQWMDSKPVSILTTLYSANAKVSCKRRSKVRGVYTELTLPQPLAIHKYNQFMNGVDRSDQMLTCHNISRKCYRWWKTLFFHLVDIAVVNGFLLFQRYRAEHPEVEALRCGNKYAVVDFREALIRQTLEWPEYDDPPAYEKTTPGESQFETMHMPEVSPTRRHCIVCYRAGRGQKRVSTYCSAPQCQKYLHIQPDLNCFKTWHSHGYQRS